MTRKIGRTSREPPRARPPDRSVRKKVYLTALMTAATMFAGMSSAVLEGSSGPLQAQFNVWEAASIFASSIFVSVPEDVSREAKSQVIGFACGPLVFGPLSELLGRKDPLILGCFLSSMFQILCAVPPNFASLLVGRFLAGVFGSAPYAIGGGFFHDIFDAIHVQAGVGCFAVATAGGPAWGPVIGSGLSSTSEGYGWRWASWFVAGMISTSSADPQVHGLLRHDRHCLACPLLRGDVHPGNPRSTGQAQAISDRRLGVAFGLRSSQDHPRRHSRKVPPTPTPYALHRAELVQR